MVEGEYPDLTISLSIARQTKQLPEYTKVKGLERDKIKQMALQFIQDTGEEGTKPALYEEFLSALQWANSSDTFLPQVVAKMFIVPWGHHRYIIDKCADNPNKTLFFVHQIIENCWSRNMLLNFLDTDLYERQGKVMSS